MRLEKLKNEPQKKKKKAPIKQEDRGYSDICPTSCELVNHVAQFFFFFFPFWYKLLI